jgi:mannan polymerase II complex MNN10 subunit
MLVRSRLSAAEFLDRVRIYNDDHRDLSEQDCIRNVVNNNANGERDQTLWIPQWKINAFPEEIKCWDKSGKGWERGTFMLHFAGAWAHLKEEDPTGFLMRKYEKEIIWS